MALVTLRQEAHCGTSALTVICLFLDELIFTLLRFGALSLGSQTGIPPSK